MFIGHFGVGFAAKPVAKSTSLGTLFFAGQFIDLLWPTFLFLGWESVKIVPGATALTPLVFSHYPISHSLLAVTLWSILFGSLYFIIRRRILAAIICIALVSSHWFLDALTHQPDLPIYPNGTIKIGLGLWNYPVAAVLVELVIFLGGLFFYLKSTKPKDKIGTVSLWLLITFLIVVYFGNVFGPPPPSVKAIAWTSQAQWLIVIWGYWVDNHRELKEI